MLLLSKKKEKEKRKIAYSSTLSILIERVLYNNIENWLQFFPPFSKNQPKIDRPRCSTPSIHPSINSCYHYHPASLLSPPKALVHFNRFIQSLYRVNDPRSTVITSHRFSPTLSSPPPPSPSARKISIVYLTFSILDPPRISRSSAPLCSTSLFFHVASHRNGRVHACPRQ